MKTVLVAGATGYLGRHLVSHYLAAGWHVCALVRNAAYAEKSGLKANELIEAEATDRGSLKGKLNGVDLVVSALGITRQKDGLTYEDVDFGANRNLLYEAENTRVKHFAYVHVLNAHLMPNSALVSAKERFMGLLQASGIASTVIAPSGYFSDMADFLNMAKSGRVYLFGTGLHRINPVHGADLAEAAYTAIERKQRWLDVGGPDTFTHRQLAELAFAALGKEPKITLLPDLLRTVPLALLPRVTSQSVYGPVQFFLSAMGMDMIGEPHGSHHLAEHFAMLAAQTAGD